MRKSARSQPRQHHRDAPGAVVAGDGEKAVADCRVARRCVVESTCARAVSEPKARGDDEPHDPRLQSAAAVRAAHDAAAPDARAADQSFFFALQQMIYILSREREDPQDCVSLVVRDLCVASLALAFSRLASPLWSARSFSRRFSKFQRHLSFDL